MEDNKTLYVLDLEGEGMVKASFDYTKLQHEMLEDYLEGEMPNILRDKSLDRALTEIQNDIRDCLHKGMIDCFGWIYSVPVE